MRPNGPLHQRAEKTSEPSSRSSPPSTRRFTGPVSERRGISAAEKYAEVGDDRPRCLCHDRLKLWEKSRAKTGGHWRCAVERYLNTKRQRATPGTWAYKEVRALGLPGAKR